MRWAALIPFFIAASCGGGTCGGCLDASYQFPIDDPERPDAIVQEDVVRVRITQDFLDFVRPQLPPLIRSQVELLGPEFQIDDQGRIRIPIPDQDLFDIFIADAQLREGRAFLFLEDLEQRVDLRFTEPSGLQLVIRDLRVGLDLKIKQNIIGSTSSCPVQGDLGGSPRHAAEVSVSGRFDPGIGPRPEYPLDFDVAVSNVQLTDFGIDVLGRSRYCQERECRDCTVEIAGTCLDPGGRCVECDIFCGGVINAAASLSNILSDLIAPLIEDIFQPVIDGLIADAVGAVDGQPAKIETPIDVGELTGLDILSRSRPLGVLGAPRPGRLPVSDRGQGLGMELTFDSGLESRLADCVGDLPPFTPERGPPPVLTGVDRDGRPYHFGFTLAGTYLNQALYTAHRAGTLCLELTSDDIRELTGGAFSLNASLLSLVASDLSKLADPAAPVILELKPRNPATVRLGTGEQIGTDDMGTPLFDWLLNVEMFDVGVAFHVLIEDRYVRVFEVTTDVSAGLNLVVLPDNRIEIALGDLQIDDFQQVFNELLPNANFATVVPALLDVALGAFLNEALVFDFDLTDTVSDALGGVPVFLRVNEIVRDGVQQDYLTMSVTFSATTAESFASGALTQAFLHPTEPGLIERRPREPARPTGVVRLVVGDGLTADVQAALEYQVRVDGGLWSVWRPARADNTLVHQSSRLNLPGRHIIDVRSRFIGDYRTLDRRGVRLAAVVDPVPPRVSARRGERGIEVTVTDLETLDPRALVLEMRTDDDAWRSVSLVPSDAHAAEQTIAYAAVAGAASVALRARDGAGNPSPVVLLTLSAEGEVVDPVTAPAASAESGCRCAGTPGPTYGPMIMGLLAAAFLVRRRR